MTSYKDPERLTPTEYRYFKLLQKWKNGVNTNSLLGDNPPMSGRNLIAAHMRNLRKKVRGRYEIETIHGWGYKMLKIHS